MPIQLPPRHISETENRMTLLFCVDVLGSVTDAQLWTFAAELELMDYLSMRLILHELLDAKELQYGESALKEQLFVTEHGRQALKLFGQRLPGELRERILSAATEFRVRVMSRREVSAAYESARKNDYRLVLTVREGELPMMRIRLSTASRSLASRAVQRFDKHASELLTYLYTLAEQALEGGGQESACALPSAVTVHSTNEFSARTNFDVDEMRLSLELMLPSQEAADAFVTLMSSREDAARTARRLADLLCGAEVSDG